LKTALFYQSIISDWNHGNAHFLRGVASELAARGHDVIAYEPVDSWCMENLLREKGEKAITRFHSVFPHLKCFRYDLNIFDLEAELADKELVIVHEWNRHELVKKIGELRRRYNFRLLFHDTHHRLLTDSGNMEQYDLANYDGVLAFGGVLRDMYLEKGLTGRAWCWHEAADTRVFRPMPEEKREGDVIWIGNWGDGERSKEIEEFFVSPVKKLGIKARVHGVRYPEHALKTLQEAGIEYAGWLANYEAPLAFSRFGATVHIPRAPYAARLPGIPTIRPFEALACGIPLVSAPWEDTDGLFTESKDYLLARNKKEMKARLREILEDRALAHSLSLNGRRTILEKHTCAHRVGELFSFLKELGMEIEEKDAEAA
jgi:spore maturation protein CgeB